MGKSVVILAGGSSSRFNGDKGAIELGGKPLLRRAVDAVKGIVDEVIVVTNTKERAAEYSKIVPATVRFAIDSGEGQGPLVGALTGFEAATGDYTLLLPFDNPFVSREVVTLLFECAEGKSAAVPRWPNRQIEPLHAVYDTKKALDAAKKTLAQGKLDLASMVEKLQGVRYISTLVIEQMDPELKTFFNINTPLDLNKAKSMFQPKKSKK